MARTFPPSFERLRREPGIALSLLLHALMLAAALWYVVHRPALPQQQFRTVPVALVTLDAIPGAPGAAPAPHPGAPKPQPQAAPRPEGTAPKAVAQPEDELSAKLRALAQLKAPDTSLAIGGGDGTAGAAGSGNYALKDFIRAQILRRWLPDLSSAANRDMPVLVRVTLTKDGVITGVDITDRVRFANDMAFRGMALSARNAALLASPIPMPPGRFPAIIKLDIDLDPKAALR